MKSSETNATRATRPGGILGVIGWLLAVLIAFGVSGMLVLAHEHRLQSQKSELAQTAARGAFVLVTPVLQSPLKRKIQLPANIHGYVETPIYAKVAGYLKSIRVDKGDRVRKDEVLAILESPELDQQVRNALAAYQLAKITDERYQILLQTSVIARQDADQTHAAMLQSKATYEQLLATQAYEIIKAPLDGMITARYVDPGALVPQATSPSTGSTPILALATLQPLRVYANVPQNMASLVKVGQAAAVTATQYPGRVFEGTVTRHPQALSADTLTMLVEVDLPNSDLSLYPGMYATLDLTIPVDNSVPMIPDDALVFRDGKVYAPIIRDNHLHLSEVSLGEDNGREVQITRGVSNNDLVAVNVGQGVEDGIAVQPERIDQKHP
ncbi:MAG: efflux RND transporter periplasmic adaptor subunit [Candidatus Binataceae bacterium]